MGGGGGHGGHQQSAHQMKGADIEYELPLTVHDIAAGTSKTLTLQLPSGSKDTMTVQIPKGMITGKKLRIAGRGQPSPYGGPAGDLYIKSKVIHDPVYTIKDHDLTISREIKLSESLLGTQISVPTVDGKQLNLKIPPGTKHKNKMRLAGHGIPHMKGGGSGDLFVEVLVQIPKRLSDKQKQLIEKLAEAGI
jgi:curved DNA-binding protein